MNLNNNTHNIQNIKLNSEQLAAVQQTEGPVMIIARIRKDKGYYRKNCTSTKYGNTGTKHISFNIYK